MYFSIQTPLPAVAAPGFNSIISSSSFLNLNPSQIMDYFCFSLPRQSTCDWQWQKDHTECQGCCKFPSINENYTSTVTSVQVNPEHFPALVSQGSLWNRKLQCLVTLLLLACSRTAEGSQQAGDGLHTFSFGKGSAGTGTGTAHSPWGCLGHGSLGLLITKLTKSVEYVNAHFGSTQWGGGFHQKLLTLIYFYRSSKMPHPSLPLRSPTASKNSCVTKQSPVSNLGSSPY